MTIRSSKKTYPDSSERQFYKHIVLVHYHEIGLKGRNRSYFEGLLRDNIQLRLASQFTLQSFAIRRVSGRLQVVVPSKTAAYQAAEIIKDIPGVVRVSVGLRLAQNLELINPVALQLLQEAEPFSSFKVSAHRANTDFPINSMQLNQSVGAWLLERIPDKRVLMRSPDVTLHLDMVEGGAFLYTYTQPGVGGLPVGSAGKVVSLLSAGIDSPVATWQLLRRGAECIGLHFSGRPETSDTSEHLVSLIAERLQPYGGLLKLFVVPFGDYQRQIAQLVPAPLRVVFYRRLMFAVAETLAIQEGAKALVTGESLGQVASQTLDNIRAVNEVVDLPVLRPLIGMDKLQIIALAEQLNTFEISSQAHDDCCTLFIPRNPETHARLATVKAIWEELPVSDWLRNIMDEIEFIDTKSVSQAVERFTDTGGVTGGDTEVDTSGHAWGGIGSDIASVTGVETGSTNQGRGD